jgi:hypothetical protein
VVGSYVAKVQPNLRVHFLNGVNGLAVQTNLISAGVVQDSERVFQTTMGKQQFVMERILLSQNANVLSKKYVSF